MLISYNVTLLHITNEELNANAGMREWLHHRADPCLFGPDGVAAGLSKFSFKEFVKKFNVVELLGESETKMFSCPFCHTELPHLQIGNGGVTSSYKPTAHDCHKWDGHQSDPAFHKWDDEQRKQRKQEKEIFWQRG